MIEIKFRGKRLDNGEWVSGDLVSHYENQRRFIICDQLSYTYTECGINRLVSENYYEVDPATIGQFTGLKDRSGVDIYEGDMVEYFGYEVQSGRQIRPKITRKMENFIKDTYTLICVTEGTGQKVEIVGD